MSKSNFQRKLDNVEPNFVKQSRNKESTPTQRDYFQEMLIHFINFISKFRRIY